MNLRYEIKVFKGARDTKYIKQPYICINILRYVICLKN